MCDLPELRLDFGVWVMPIEVKRKSDPDAAGVLGAFLFLVAPGLTFAVVFSAVVAWRFAWSIFP